MLKILPQSFYESPEINKILVDGLSCVIHKILDEPVWHKEGYVSTHAITLVMKGLLRIENDQGLFTEVTENKMIFLPKGLYTISDIIPGNAFFEAMVFYFDESLIAEFINSIQLKSSKGPCISHLMLNYNESLRLFTTSLLELYGDRVKPPRELTRMKLFEFLHLIRATQQNDHFQNALSSLNNKAKRGLKAFMHNNFTKPLSIEDYAYLTGRSISTFRRDFKTQFGISPKQWLIERRLQKAKQLLTTNAEHNISDIAYESGYENIPHFIKSFQKKYGTTPKQWQIKERKEALV